jgi:Zn ribbon nucleic-acid-binding protein
VPVVQGGPAPDRWAIQEGAAMEKRAKATPLVAGSKQAWRVTLGIGAMVVAAAASIFQLVGPSELKGPAIGVAIASGLLGIAALLAVRCPSCGRSLGLWAFRTGTLTTWHERLVEARACPYCGHAAADAGPRR